jgi:hypothetical protein
MPCPAQENRPMHHGELCPQFMNQRRALNVVRPREKICGQHHYPTPQPACHGHCVIERIQDSNRAIQSITFHFPSNAIRRFRISSRATANESVKPENKEQHASQKRGADCDPEARQSFSPRPCGQSAVRLRAAAKLGLPSPQGPQQTCSLAFHRNRQVVN